MKPTTKEQIRATPFVKVLQNADGNALFIDRCCPYRTEPVLCGESCALFSIQKLPQESKTCGKIMLPDYYVAKLGCAGIEINLEY